jgi:hypothetical protein
MDGTTPAPPPRPNFTMKPAMIVGGLAVVILLAFSVAGALTHTATTTGTPPTGTLAVKGSGLRAVSATKGLSAIEQDGEPPANVLDAITLPVGAVVGSSTNPGLGSTFDHEVSFSVGASQQAVLTFYKAELHAFGWRTVTSGPATHTPGQQIVGQLAGDDGFYWQLGVIVAPSTFGTSGTADVTKFTLRVLQVDDQD